LFAVLAALLNLQGTWTVAFQSSMDALRFTHAAQMMLMQTHWPPCAHEYCGLSLPSADGRMLFQGPRVCMAVHEASEYLVRLVCSVSVPGSSGFW
jgi:hypothetical protein